MLKGILLKMEEMFLLLKPSERKIATYILEQPSEIIDYSVQKLAKAVDVSEASIVRFSKTLECKGFQDLKLRIAYDLNEYQEKPSYDEIIANAGTNSLIQSVSQNNIQSIQDTVSILSEKDMEAAIQAIDKARKIAVFGVGASGVIAEDLKQKLSRIGRWCEAGYGFDSQATISANLTSADVVIGISNAGRTEDVIQSLSLAKDMGAAVITLTQFGRNPTSQLADFALYVKSLENPVRSGAFSSRIAMLNIIDILYLGIASMDEERTIQKLEQTRRAVQYSKRKTP